MTKEKELVKACEVARKWFYDFCDDKLVWEDQPAADIATILDEAIRAASN